MTTISTRGQSAASWPWSAWVRGLSKCEPTEEHPIPVETAYLNSLNATGAELPTASDVVVVGGGIHSLIYAIHARLKSLRVVESGHGRPEDPVSITVIEKSPSPGYKIGESTLTTFGLWLKSIGISTALAWRLFGPKDGLCFYYLPHNGDNDGYTDFCANGPAGDFVATLQVERKISELLLTLFAQRLGVNIFHGHAVNIDSTKLPTDTDNGPRVAGRVDVLNQGGNDGTKHIDTKLVVDATGRFRRFASKAARATRLPHFNTDSFWAYFEMDGDETDIPLRHYESCHTNHICLAEGWAWVIRLPSWEGSSTANLARMINHLLDLDAAGTPADDYPSSHELARKFDCRFRWVTSIGYALRNDVVYPDDLASYGSCEAERKFNWITSRYPRMQQLMDRHRLVPDLYGPATTWFVRKTLTYSSPVVAGPGWAAIGDAAGFTNPLYSPGINCNMGTSVFLAEQTAAYLSPAAENSPAARNRVLARYNDYCISRVPHLHRMNVFNYLMMRSPRTGPLGPLWQYLCGTGNAEWQHIKDYASSLERVAELVTTWEWGADRPEYVAFADKAIQMMDGPPTAPAEEVVDAVLALSEGSLRAALATGKYSGRWAGLLRYYDDELKFCDGKIGRDVLAMRCDSCRNWRILTGTARRCPTCGMRNSVEAIERYN